MQNRLLDDFLQMHGGYGYVKDFRAAPSADAVAEAARLLANAKKPVILMGRVSRSMDDWKARIALAEVAFPFTAPPHADAADKNRPLVEDIRLLGRILGDVIREQEGKDAFELVERVRQLSVGYRLKRDAQAGRALDRLLKNLSGDQTVSVIRAFSYFSHLANIAEDRHHVDRKSTRLNSSHT
mgnify:CR=1 FL=1